MLPQSISYIAAFTGGLIAFFSPCLLPLLPSYISVISGFTFKELYGLNFDKIRGRIFLSSLFFVLGFMIVFTILGAVGLAVSKLLFSHIDLFTQVSGAGIIFFGLIQLGVINFEPLQFDYAWNIQKRLARLGFLTAFLMGIACAFIWIPCIGQILGSILLLATQSSTVQDGTILLGLFSLGLSTPFLILGLFFPAVFKLLKDHRLFFHLFSKLGGIFLIIFGVLLLFKQYGFYLQLFTDITLLFLKK